MIFLHDLFLIVVVVVVVRKLTKTEFCTRHVLEVQSRVNDKRVRILLVEPAQRQAKASSHAGADFIYSYGQLNIFVAVVRTGEARLEALPNFLLHEMFADEHQSRDALLAARPLSLGTAREQVVNPLEHESLVPALDRENALHSVNVLLPQHQERLEPEIDLL